MSLNDIFSGGFDVESNYEEEKSGFTLLPKIDNAVVAITESTVITKYTNDDEKQGVRWRGIRFDLQVTGDGEWGGEFIGRETNHLISLFHTDYPDMERNGKQELARWAKAVGLVTLNHESEFNGRQLAVNIDQRPNKKKTKEAKSMNPNAEPVMDQKFYSPKAIGATAPMQQAPQMAAQQQQQQQTAPQAVPNAFASNAANPFNQ